MGKGSVGIFAHNLDASDQATISAIQVPLPSFLMVMEPNMLLTSQRVKLISQQLVSCIKVIISS